MCVAGIPEAALWFCLWGSLFSCVCPPPMFSPLAYFSRVGKYKRDDTMPSQRRYEAATVKGDNAWKREWQGFISGVKMTEQGTAVKLPSCLDYEQSSGSNFSYLFGSSSQKKSQRLSKTKKDEEAQKRKRREKELARLKAAQDRGEAVDVDWDDPFNERSKHQKTLLEAQRRGLQLEGMTRKQIRDFLHLSVSKEQELALEAQREKKPHELMDEKLQWYQQGPYPLDLISEKLVVKKALKHAKQSGMKYNYLTVHPSWVASRAKKRREERNHAHTAIGIQLTFDDDGNVEDEMKLRALHIMSHKARLERMGASSEQGVPEAGVGAAEGIGSEVGPRAEAQDALASLTKGKKASRVDPLLVTAPPAKKPGFRQTLQNANLSTNYITTSLINGPSLGLEARAHAAATSKRLNEECAELQNAIQQPATRPVERSDRPLRQQRDPELRPRPQKSVPVDKSVKKRSRDDAPAISKKNTKGGIKSAAVGKLRRRAHSPSE